ncbi:MAG: heavy metal-responsive transcriptional regulator [Candidatus Nanopelagicales bacterium]
MRIGELAARAGTSTKALRYYEERGLLPRPARSAGGYRAYDDDAVARLAFIRSGQALGLTLAEIGGLLAIRDDGRAPCAAATDLLDDHLAELGRRIRGMQSLRRGLRHLRDRAASLDPADCPPDSVCHILNPAPCSCAEHASA